MSDIWKGPGVLRSGPDFKGKESLLPGNEVPKGFVSSKRVKQLKKAGKIVDSAAYTSSMAAAGQVPVENAAGKIKQLTADNKVLTDDNEALGTDNERLQEESKGLQEEKKTLKAEIETLKAAGKVGG